MSTLVSDPVSINWTITTCCNYRCKYCFAHFPELQHCPILSFDQMRQVPPLLADAGCQKLTFVGGEPTLHPLLPELLNISKEIGLTTMLVSNGSTLTPSFIRKLEPALDWLCLSVDSQFEDVQLKMGRGSGPHVAQTLRNVALVRETRIRLKLNTVVTRNNLEEDMSGFVESLWPWRWKVFQFLPIQGENDSVASELAVSEEEFNSFKDRHSQLPVAVFENNKDMTGSYVMLSPQGQFFSNFNGVYRYSESILDRSVHLALEQVGWDKERFLDRGGLYDWNATTLQYQDYHNDLFDSTLWR